MRITVLSRPADLSGNGSPLVIEVRRLCGAEEIWCWIAAARTLMDVTRFETEASRECTRTPAPAGPGRPRHER